MTDAVRSALARAVDDSAIVVVCGAGGVGKTSVSAALALEGARRRKSIVLTIDPAKRLASALGMGGEIGHDERRVKAEGVTLSAAMLDMKRAWDDMVDRYAPDRAVAERIKQNPLYKGLSEHFVGSHGYMAMERLAELHERGDYDLIVIDTPPTRHALDFLDAPKRMTDFVGGSLLRFIARPYTVAGRFGARAFSLTASPFLKVADRVLGSQVLEELAAFVLDFQTLYDDFKRRAASVLRLLQDARTGFVVVTTPLPPAMREARYFVDRLVSEDIRLAGVVVNRMVPASFGSGEAAAAVGALASRSAQVADALTKTASLTRADADDVAGYLHDRLLDLQTRSVRDHGRADDLADRDLPTARVPLLAQDVHDLSGLAELASHITG